MGKKRFNDYPFSYRQEIELEITTLTNLGVGLGRIVLETPHLTPPAEMVSRTESGRAEDRGANESARHGEGDGKQTGEGARESSWVVMCAFALPGERVRARVFRNHKNYSEADLLAVLRPSPHRIAPPCAVFGRCGGCQYQQLEYSEQLAWKRRQAEELLRHMAGIEFPVSPVIGSPRQYGYRSKITPHFNPPRRHRDDQPAAPGTLVPPLEPIDERTLPIGFLRQGTRFDIVDVPRCEIATERINQRLVETRENIRARAAAGEFTRGSTILLREASGEVTTEYDKVITEEVDDVRLQFLARDFFQNNPFILPKFTDYVREQAGATGARFLVDAYCGSGLFALTAARKFERVAGVEISETSVQFARRNAELNQIANATFQAGEASAIFANLTFAADDTVVVIDPPRKGCDTSFLDQLFNFNPRAVVYVSCDPATQMRDLKFFINHGYHLTAVQPFDLFPQTRHLECVITLRR
ncbi:MAG TPA: class I SAM-dependent RNA methyltransferase [Opitutaceae bacterium]|nr:class I SAM-dependent RNA methyltransferase [Opitutaceae bacterium]